jgi:hypothetical protein
LHILQVSTPGYYYRGYSSHSAYSSGQYTRVLLQRILLPLCIFFRSVHLGTATEDTGTLPTLHILQVSTPGYFYRGYSFHSAYSSGQYTWVLLQRILLPLCIFFRSVLYTWVLLQRILFPLCIFFRSVLYTWVLLQRILFPLCIFFRSVHLGTSTEDTPPTLHILQVSTPQGYYYRGYSSHSAYSSGQYTWVLLQRILFPLCIFFRSILIAPFFYGVESYS